MPDGPNARQSVPFVTGAELLDVASDRRKGARAPMRLPQIRSHCRGQTDTAEGFLCSSVSRKSKPLGQASCLALGFSPLALTCPDE